MFSLAAAITLLALAAPTLPLGRGVDRLAAECDVSDTDLVGKRLARSCRAALRQKAARRPIPIRS